MTLSDGLREQLDCALRVHSPKAVAVFLGISAWAIFGSAGQAAELVGATAGELGVSPSGSASYSIPIAVPAGTTGLQPKITLQYDSLAGNGVAGMGWSIGGLSAISRCPTSYTLDGTAAGSPGIDPVDFDANDKYCLNGQRLVPVAGAYGANGTEYRTTQDEFSRIVSFGTVGSGPQWFKVWRKGGEIMEFGNTADSRIEALGRSDVIVWAVNKLSDTAENYETFTYVEDAVNGGYRIARIDYTGNAAQGLAPYNRVDFVYAARSDVMKSWQAGAKMTLDQRLTNIKVYADSSLYRDYQITYETILPLSLRSRPVSVTECATNTTTSALDCFPPTTFQWSQDGQATLTTKLLDGTQGVNTGMFCPGNSNGYTLGASGDFNGDGLTDLYFFCAGNWGGARAASAYPDHVLLATGDATFQDITVPAASSLPATHVVAGVGDFNGDGLTDFFTFGGDEYGRNAGTYYVTTPNTVWISNGDGTFNQVAQTAANTATPAHRVFSTGDYNGDGLTDLFLACTGTDLRFFNCWNVSGGNTPTVLLGQSTGALKKVAITPASGIDITSYFSYSVGASGDFNGDGLTDMYVFASSAKGRKAGPSFADHFWLSKWAPNGSGGTLTFVDVTLPAAQSLPADHGISGAGDFNGDGLTDFYETWVDSKLRAGDQTDRVWLSKGDMSFSVISGIPVADQLPNEFRVTATGDFDGDGLTDLYAMATQDDAAERLKDVDGDFILRSKGTGLFQKVVLTNAGFSAAFEDYQVKATGDFNGDGLTDIYSYKADIYGRSNGNTNDYIFKSAWKFPDQLIGVTTGLGLTAKVAYKPLTDTSVYTKGTGSAYPVAEVIAPRYVVSEVRADNGIGGENAQSYKYQALRTHLKDIGSLGFAKTVVTDGAKNITTESVYSQDWAAGMEGLLLSSKTIAPAPYNVTLSEQTLSWAVASGTTADGTPRKFRYSPSSTTVKKDLNGTLLGTATETTAYDDGAGDFFANYGFPRQVTMATTEPGGAVTYTKTTTNTYTHDAANWLLGRLTAASVVHQETGKPLITRTSSFTYDSGTGLITSETVEPGSVLFHTKTYGYNGFGAVTSLTETWGSQNADSIQAP